MSSELTNTKKFPHSNVTPSFDSSASCSFFHPSARIHPPFSSSLSTLSLLCCCYCSRSFLFSGSLHSLTWRIAWNAKIYTLFVLQTKYILGSCWLLRHKKRGEIFLLGISSFVIFPEFQFFFCSESIGCVAHASTKD